MTFSRGNLGFFITFLLIGGILGAALGTLVAKLVPALAVVNTNLTGQLSLNLEIVSLGFRINLAGIFGMVIGVLIFRKV